ncbi:MAG: hypothetical protein KAU89_01855 [Candidatus Thorarchaeota archaeon]|jgi:hypothetical protein|nr:hypothetical protein [Candidatus Thorarchaeota archaeon]
MSGKQDNSAPASSSVTHEEVTVLEVDAVDISYDDRFLYAACKDKFVRVWSKGDWQLVAELGETNSEPLAVHVDKDHVYATCERRVYMWRKGTWGMIGWFELSYHALTSNLHGDCFYIGTREGRLLSIKRDTNETSSWPLHKSEIAMLWSNGSVICSGTKKEAPVVWTPDLDTAPTELAVLDKSDRGTAVTGNSQFVMVALTSGDVKLWDRVGWNHVRTLESQTDEPLISMWANDLYLVTSSTAGFLTIWDLKNSIQLGQIRKNGIKYGEVAADHDLIYVASSEGLVVIGISLEGQALDLCKADNRIQDDHLLKTSPYDVLESVLSHQSQGDNSLQERNFSKAMEEYDTALQLLVDNVHALQAVPEEREKLTREISSRRNKASLRSKIESIQSIDKEIEQISDELDLKGQTLKDEAEIDSLWSNAESAIQESRTLSEDNADDMLSYQLTYLTDDLQSDLEAAKEKLVNYQRKVNQAIALTHGMENEWRWMEQRRTSLSERKGFLERTIKQLEKELANAESDSEVQEILKGALDKHKQIHEQIGRIISASDDEQETVLSSREDALAAIHGLLGIMPKKRNAMLAISDHTKRQNELERLTTALEEALESAKSHGLKEETRSIQNEIESVASLNGAARTENT